MSKKQNKSLKIYHFREVNGEKVPFDPYDPSTGFPDHVKLTVAQIMTGQKYELVDKTS